MTPGRLLLLTASLLAACDRAPGVAVAPREIARAGAKVSLPIRVEASPSGRVPASSDVPVTITLTPEVACSALSTEIRGTRGLRVTAGYRKPHARCVAGEPTTRTVRAWVPRGIRGILAVDIRLTVAGRVMQATESFPLAGGTDAKPVLRPLAPAVPDGRGDMMVPLDATPSGIE